jgi:Flp pilus assembly protein TadB
MTLPFGVITGQIAARVSRAPFGRAQRPGLWGTVRDVERDSGAGLIRPWAATIASGAVLVIAVVLLLAGLPGAALPFFVVALLLAIRAR